MAPGPIEIGPASGPNVTLEVKKDAAPPAKSPAAPNHEEHQYLDLIRDILANGEHRPDRYDLLTIKVSIHTDRCTELEQAHSQSSPPLNCASPSRAPRPTPHNYLLLYSPSSLQNVSSHAP
jgi:thymidylate synthase